ncbi:MAG: carboxypeptidase-like regulatory domain-containing protein, partial [Bacteroidota bacterium]
MIRLSIITILSLLFYWSALAQHIVRGTIQDDTNEPLMYANVLLLSEAETLIKGEVADLDGNFTFENIPSGSYFLGVSAVGYADFRQAINVTIDVDMGTLTVAQSSTLL